MMNLIAISLIATTFAVSGLFSPNPVTNPKGDQVIVKDGHRAVVVEYADDVSGDGNTKVLISPPRHSKVGPTKEPDLPAAGVGEEALSRATASVAEDVKEKAKEAMHGGPRELICDAYGKCKHKVAGVLGRAKDAAVEAEETVKEKIVETGEKVRDKTEDIVSETKEKVKEKGKEGKREISDIGRRGKELAVHIFEPVGNIMNLMGFGIAYGMGVWVTFVMSYVLGRVLGREQFGVVQSKVYPTYFKGMVGSIGLCLLGHLLGHRGMLFKNKAEILQGYNLMSCLVSVLGNLLFLEPRATKVMFERMKLEKEEGRGIDTRGAPAKVIDTVVTEPTTTAAAPTTTTTATTAAARTTTVAGTQPARPDQEAVKSKLGKLDERLKKLNSYSSLLNIMTLAGLTWHLVYLSQRLGATT
ncbi:hypothetical protein RND81_01G211800 [Saponaria officinalis]|uniref:TMEM205-like domain-containing protein n=1 Tax=Saponaria officinalis TaxID=3572 RepID=A0AAW1NH13_SAPOF